MSEDLIDAWLDGSIDAASRERLAAAAAADPALAVRLREQLRLHRLLGAGLTPDDTAAAWERFDATWSSQRRERTLAGVQLRLARRRRGLPWRWMVGGALAAAAVLAVVLAWPGAAGPLAPGSAELDAVGTVTVSAGGETRDGRDGQPVAPGATVTVAAGGSATLRWGDGTRLALGSDSVLDLEADGGKRFSLRQGALQAEVAPQPPAAPFAIRFAAQRLQVLGTGFEVATGADGSRVAVSHGCVSVADEGQAFETLLFAGDTWSRTPGTAFATRGSDPVAIGRQRGLGRAGDGLIACWRFDEGSGLTARDSSGVGEAMDLQLVDAAAAEWTADGLAVRRLDGVAYRGPAGKLRPLLAAGQGFTIEVVLSQAGIVRDRMVWPVSLAPDGVRRVLSVSGSVMPAQPGQPEQPLRHLALIFGPAGVDAHFDGWARLRSGSVSNQERYRELQAAAGAGRDLALILPASSTPIGFSTPDPNQLTPWPVTIRWLAIYDRPLPPEAIRRNALIAAP